MQLKNQVEWALHCCSVLAAVPEGKAVPASVLAEFHGVPKDYLAKALQNLAQAGIIIGTLGPSGGYRLANDPAEVTFLDIIEAIEGQRLTFVCNGIRRNNPCLTGDEKRCTMAQPCVVAKVMWDADEAWRNHLRSVRLSDLLKTLSDEIPADILDKGQAWMLDRC
tara:strand:- start:420 stop:914 length:495 start_codon:yes stop_codon:yes gene_type:complete